MTVKLTCPEYEDLKYLAENLRQSDLEELYAAGEWTDILECLTHSVNVSTEVYVLKSDDVPFAIFGVAQQGQGSACVWLLATDTLEEYKKSFMRLTKKIKKEFHAKYGNLFNYIYDKNIKTKKWLGYLGAEFAEDTVSISGSRKEFRLFILKR